MLENVRLETYIATQNCERIALLANSQYVIGNYMNITNIL